MYNLVLYIVLGVMLLGITRCIKECLVGILLFYYIFFFYFSFKTTEVLFVGLLYNK